MYGLIDHISFFKILFIGPLPHLLLVNHLRMHLLLDQQHLVYMLLVLSSLLNIRLLLNPEHLDVHFSVSLLKVKVRIMGFDHLPHLIVAQTELRKPMPLSSGSAWPPRFGPGVV